MAGFKPCHHVINSGALVLGVWGIRSILLGSNVPGLTSVDLALSVVILFLLAAITARALMYLQGRRGIRMTIPLSRRTTDADAADIDPTETIAAQSLPRE